MSRRFTAAWCGQRDGAARGDPRLPSTETTFYAAAVYFGGRGLRSTRYTIPAALCGDCMAVVLSIISIRLFG